MALLAVFLVQAVLTSARGSGNDAGPGSLPAPGELTALVVHPSDPTVLLAGRFEHGLVRSRDRGATWQALTNGPGPLILGLEIHPIQPSTLYAIEAELGVVKSLDSGDSWQVTSAGLTLAGAEIRQLAIDPDEPETLYVTGGRGLFRSEDGARSWTRLSGVPADPVRVVFPPDESLGIYLVAGRFIYRSDDFGAHWRRLGAILPGDLAAQQINDLLIDPAATNVLYAATSAGLYRSSDSGRSWRPDGLSGNVRQVAIDPRNPLGLLAVTEFGLLRRLASGEPWLQIASAPASTLAIDPFDPATLYLGDRQGSLVVTNDAGVTFRSLLKVPSRPLALGRKRQEPEASQLEFDAAGPEPGHPVTALAIDPDQPEVAYAGTFAGVFRTTNFGASWQLTRAGLELTDVHSLAIDPETPTRLYAGTHGGGLFRSDDAGGSWQPARRGLDMAAIHAVVVDPLEPSILYAGGRGGLFTSSDFAKNWRRLLPATAGIGAVRDLSYALSEPLQLWLATSTGRVVAWDVASQTGRAAPVPLGLTDAFRGDPLAELYAIDAAALTIRSLAVDPGDAAVLSAATAYGVWRSSESGRSWGRLPIDASVAALAIDLVTPERLFVGTSRGLLWTEDGSSWWEVHGLQPRSVASLAVASQAPHSVIYAGLADSRVWVSRDSGEVWNAYVLAQPLAPWSPPAAAQVAEQLPPPKDEALRRLRRTASAVPRHDPRLQALAILELQRRLARDEAGRKEARSLATRLRELRALVIRWQQDHGDERPQRVSFSDDNRWLKVEFSFDDGRRSHNELRLYDLEAIDLSHLPQATVSRAIDPLLHLAVHGNSRLAWQAVGDPDREPEHLHPTWILPDAGDSLGWSPGGRYLVTRPALGEASVWRIAAKPRAAPRRFEPLSPRVPARRHLLTEVPLSVAYTAWSGDDRWLALAGERADGEAQIYIVDLHTEHRHVFASADFICLAVGFTPDGRWLWIAGAERFLALLLPAAAGPPLIFEAEGDLWRLLQGDLPGLPPSALLAEVATSPDGRWLAGRAAVDAPAVSSELLLWSLLDDDTLAEPHRLDSAAAGLRFSPNSRCLAAGRQPARLWDLPALAPDRYAAGFPTSGPFTCERAWISVSAEGASLSRHIARRTRLQASRRPELPVALAAQAPVELDKMEVEVSPSGRWAVSVPAVDAPYGPQVLSFWNLATEPQRRVRLRAGRHGSRELHRDEGPRRQLGDFDPLLGDDVSDGQLAEQICRLVGRNLTRQEWRIFLADEPYLPACSWSTDSIAATVPSPGR